MYFFLSVLWIIFFIPQSVLAYIDPGSGSYIIQIIIATLLGGLTAIKLFWRNIKLFLKNFFSRKRKDE